jgi:protein phosphatase
MAEQRTFAIETSRFAAAGSRQGPRHRENEDALRLAEAATPELFARYGNLYVVCDGVGGHNRGEVASALAVETLAQAYFKTPGEDAVADLDAAVAAANVEVLRSAEADEASSGMATTVVAVAIRGGQIFIANVGDSRAYLISGGTIRQLSRDHSLVQDQVERGFITPEEARVSPQRNVITRALGLADTVETELRTQDGARRASTRLLLCTDGVHGVVEDAELAQHAGTQEPVEAVRAILELVDQRNGRDDATLVIVDLDAEVAPAATPPAAATGSAAGEQTTPRKRGFLRRLFGRGE